MNVIDLDEYKKIICDILKHFDLFCRKNNIKYSLFGGTNIGAIRHSGFIPWDDDIDVIMLPEDFEKFRRLYKEKNDVDYYEYVDYKTNKSYNMPFSKIIDTRLVAEEVGMAKIDNYGPYIDIFRYNYVPNNYFKRKIFLIRYKIYISFIRGYAIRFEEKNIIKRIRNFIAKKINIHKLVAKFDKMLCENNNSITKYIVHNFANSNDIRNLQESNDYLFYKDVKFEDIICMVPQDDDKVLKIRFGDYMKLPPEIERINHHNIKAYWKKNK